MKLPKGAIKEIEQGLEANQVCQVACVNGIVTVYDSSLDDLHFNYPILVKSARQPIVILSITKNIIGAAKTELGQILIPENMGEYWMLGIKGYFVNRTV